jgi:FkbM family methyltransferase
MGIFNYENYLISGENHFLHYSLSKFLMERTDCVMFDIGANEGSYSCKIKEIYPMAEIFAFEPHPKTFRKLQLKAEKYEFKVFNVAAGKIAGKRKLYDYDGEDNSGTQHASLYKDVIENLHGMHEISEIEVEVVDLDNFIRDNKLKKISLLKIDTEGNELEVLIGAKDSIENEIIDLIHFEFNVMNVISRTFFKDFYDILPDYDFFRMLPDGLIPLGEYLPIQLELFGFQNIVAIPKRLSKILKK